MLKEVSKEIWEKEIADKSTSIFDEPEYLETVAELHNTKIYYWIFYKKKKGVLGFATHVKGKSIIVPDHYSYSSFWFDDSLRDFSFFDVLDQSLHVLKFHFRNFAFRLPPEVKDIRAFNLSHSLVKVTYTYVINTNNQVQYRENIEAKLKDAKKYDFVFLINSNPNKALIQQMEDFKLFGYTNSNIKFYHKYFKKLIEKGFIFSYSLNLNENLKASSLIIIDKKSSQAFNLLHSTSKKNDSSQSSAFLYHQIITDLSRSGITNFDLYGSDMKGIANFKSGFKGELQPHYTVYYSAKRAYYLESLQKLKVVVKKFL